MNPDDHAHNIDILLDLFSPAEIMEILAEATREGKTLC